MSDKTPINYQKCVLYFEGGKITVKGQTSYVNNKGILVTIGAYAKIVSDDKEQTLTLAIKDFVSIPKSCEAIENDPKIREFIEQIQGHEKQKTGSTSDIGTPD